MNNRPLVVQSEHLAEPAVRWLAERCDLASCRFDDPRFLDTVRNAQGLIVRTYTDVNRSLLDGAPQLRVVGRAGAGLDNIDVTACRERDVEVVYTPDANTQAVVEYVFTLLTDVLRPIVPIEEAVDQRTWDRLRGENVAERQLSDLTLGILGLGRIGSRVAEVALALGIRTRYSDIRDIPRSERRGATVVDVHELFASSDIISLHIDGRPENRGTVRADLLELLKPDAVLINTSRGFVVDNTALAMAMDARPGAVALLDVHEPEPIAHDSPLLGRANVRLYPHLASRTQTAMENMSWVVRDVIAVLEGRPPGFPAPTRV